MKTIEATLIANDLSIAIISTRWNHFIVDKLVEGARTTFNQHGGNDDNLHHIIAPGAHEVPLLAKVLATSKKYDAIVCLGAVIRGSTDHYDYVAGGAANGILNTSLQTDTPIAFGILTTDTTEQALERAGIKAGNKGVEAMLAMIETVNLLKTLSQ